jgi:hypothetical protein
MSQIQSVIFKTSYGWTPRTAQMWLRREGIMPMKGAHVTSRGLTIRYRIQPPSLFSRFRILRSYAGRKLGSEGIEFVIGFPR